MEWKVKYEPRTRTLPWSVYKHCHDSLCIFEQGFWTEEEAKDFSLQKEKNFERPDGERISKIEEASIQSFPASDPPAWTGSISHCIDKEPLKRNKPE